MSTTFSLPHKVVVAALISSRYGEEVVPEHSGRPLSWDARVAGVDTIRTVCGLTVPLASSGQQSVPFPGWGIVLTGGDAQAGFSWTLYSMPKGSSFNAPVY